MTIAEKLTTIAENEQKVYEAGKKQGVYEWWDDYQNWYGAVDNNDWMYAFAGPCWTDTVYQPIREIRATGRSTNMFAYSGITDTKVPIYIDATNATNKGGTFMNATKLVTVCKFVVNEIQAMHQQFTNCTKLQNLTIEGTIAKDVNTQWCPLTKASILSVFAALSDTATDVTATFNTTAVNTAFETATGAADGSTSAEWAALVATKPNWAVELVE